MDTTTQTQPALAQRLRAAAEVLLDVVAPPAADPFVDAGNLLEQLVPAVQQRSTDGRLWLLLVALTGEFPLHEDVEDVRRALELTSSIDAQQRLLELSLAAITSAGDMANTMQIVTDRPIVDVHFTANSDLLTGIQRVVRHVVPRWHQAHQLILGTWTPAGTALRELSDDEQAWLASTGSRAQPERWPTPVDSADEGSRLLVPWHVPVVLPEVPGLEHAFRLSALARHAASPVAVIGYDCIPIISGELVGPSEHAKFVSYLNVVKYASQVVCISLAAAEEFGGFVDALGAQGLPGPQVLTCPLPNGADIGELTVDVVDQDTNRAATPTVVCVGSIDRRKNQIVLLEAAEQLWRQGHQFALRFIGSGGLAPADFSEWSAELIAAGRPLTIETDVSDATLRATIRSARFTVFLSLHEGFGLPIAESLAMGVPVLTSNIGSMGLLAEDDGALTVAPLDVEAVTNAVRRLLTDDELVLALSNRARSRPRRSWDDYAGEAWAALVGPDPGSPQ